MSERIHYKELYVKYKKENDILSERNKKIEHFYDELVNLKIVHDDKIVTISKLNSRLCDHRDTIDRLEKNVINLIAVNIKYSNWIDRLTLSQRV